MDQHGKGGIDDDTAETLAGLVHAVPEPAHWLAPDHSQSASWLWSPPSPGSRDCSPTTPAPPSRTARWRACVPSSTTPPTLTPYIDRDETNG
ncbi:hypothetical protein ACGF8B_25595 [Streptomyces sp. NPDC047917]|uniref:hypothetical protein n=1 Tax=Streptomyces sp. NPDC047917 TaxID=3365491 RepID=UPI003723D16B